MITGKSMICGIIGDPIEHSMSPVMHNAAFKKLGIDYVYVPFRVRKEGLEKSIQGVRALNIRGINVTIPHKVAVMPLLDEIDPIAVEIGAVNTIVNDDGILKGYNTDASGFLQALLEQGIEPGNKKIVILGAGGASRAISFILARRGARLVILNRNQSKAHELAERIQRGVKGLGLNETTLSAELSRADVLINATSAGMSPDIDDTPVPPGLLRPELVVFDAVYNPLKTRLLREAEKVGARTISGIDMLVWQGALAFGKWTGQKAPVELMKREAIRALQKHEN